MKPLINALITCGNEKPVWIPIPIPIDCGNIKIFADRTKHFNERGYNYDDEKVLAYRSSFGVTPDANIPWYDVADTVKCLSKFTPEQLVCVKDICSAFNLTFEDIDGFILFLSEAKDITEQEICKNGIPMKNKKPAIKSQALK